MFFRNDGIRKGLEATSTDDLKRLLREFPNSQRNAVILDILTKRNRSLRLEISQKIGQLGKTLSNAIK